MSIGLLFIKFCVQIKLSTIIGGNELVKGSNICPIVLKVDLEAIVKMEMTNTSHVISAMIRYSTKFIFYKAKVSNLGC